MQIDVVNIKGEQTGRQVELPDSIFGIEPNDHTVYLSVKQYLAAQRQGTHKTKGRSEVQGSTRKLHRQKGTGGSRKGNIRNPLYKGGGRIGGPQPRDYSFKLNRKVKDLAKMSALTYKAKEGKIVVVEDVQMETPKTKEFLNILSTLQGDVRRSLFIIREANENLYLSSRNIQSTKMVILNDMNTYDLVNSGVLIFTESAAKLFTEEPIAEPVTEA